ncbi:TetR/AcrR family transcriptional regulator [Naasia aerilata]|uniref:Transcriptional regulator, TetR family protein n=1 Tax=Naasia aerilata TaxID=1162966 RepID=A0ABM8G9A8_9MICO|nr:TetR/AcrR family transcriptional regulator [Naasia aerilata]BDZ44774.1 putative transcriptional regulator, TetR family protein [Naasia aerilata]
MPTRSDAPRERILAAASDLFGRQGYSPTTIAQIEQAAGLSPGAGGLYRHFGSKRDLLEQVLTRQLDEGPDLGAFLSSAGDSGSYRDQLLAVARAALRRLEHERDLNRLLVRDLSAAPELLALVRDRELRTVHRGLTRWLEQHRPGGRLPAAEVATVLMGALSHYWILADVFGGEHPFGVSEEEFLGTLAEMAAAAP